ncbi:hypothetical protein K7X08_023827 [Anisodus acutangulus]|uniref:Uncharacterized protein n=1 Tax=Anisodus acutangulus TaxID=402998 RepID=A0A9Q1LAS7_9SOLA|nr:hypothetical protein K7X08_023827 [Anisodus acutangulus]
MGLSGLAIDEAKYLPNGLHTSRSTEICGRAGTLLHKVSTQMVDSTEWHLGTSKGSSNGSSDRFGQGFFIRDISPNGVLSCVVLINGEIEVCKGG